MGEGRCTCCCITYQTRVTLFAFTNVVVTAMQLIVPLISSGFILYFQLTQQQFEARYILHEETISIFQRIPSIVLKPPDSSKISNEEMAGALHSPLQSDLHVWASWIFIKLVMLFYAVLLYSGARKKGYGQITAWFALNLPMAGHSVLQLGMDYGLGVMRKKPLNFQIYQVSICVYQWLGLLFVYFYLRRVRYHQGVRYTSEFKRDADVKFRDPASLHL